MYFMYDKSVWILAAFDVPYMFCEVKTNMHHKQHMGLLSSKKSIELGEPWTFMALFFLWQNELHKNENYPCIITCSSSAMLLGLHFPYRWNLM